MIIKTMLSSLSIIFSFVMIYITHLNYKKKIIQRVGYVGWNCVWILILVASLRPSIIDFYFLDKFKIDIFYILSVLSTISLLILFYFSYIKINILEKKIDALIRSEALKNIFDKLNK